uniref:COX assembly mitochondrial protein n=1 Tax=Steinernema glaseri TaxID=37863 RepID=A0A1I7ZE38_9BILA
MSHGKSEGEVGDIPTIEEDCLKSPEIRMIQVRLGPLELFLTAMKSDKDDMSTGKQYQRCCDAKFQKSVALEHEYQNNMEEYGHRKRKKVT